MYVCMLHVMHRIKYLIQHTHTQTRTLILIPDLLGLSIQITIYKDDCEDLNAAQLHQSEHFLNFQISSFRSRCATNMHMEIPVLSSI